jgi:hypothetical protein
MVYKGGEKVSFNYSYADHNVDVYNPDDHVIKTVTSTATTCRSYYCLYEITEKDVRKFTENIVEKVNLYYTPKQSSEGSKGKKNTTEYLEYKVWKMFSDRYYKVAAQSILSN